MAETERQKKSSLRKATYRGLPFRDILEVMQNPSGAVTRNRFYRLLAVANQVFVIHLVSPRCVSTAGKKLLQNVRETGHCFVQSNVEGLDFFYVDLVVQSLH